MKIFNLSTTTVSVPFGSNNHLTIEGNSVTSTIIPSKEFIEQAIIPLVNAYGQEIKLSLSPTDSDIINNCSVNFPAENVVTEDEGNIMLNLAKKV